MKSLFAALLIVGFVGIAGFGFAFFDHDMRGQDGGCITSSIDGKVCPTSLAGMTVHHISVLQVLSQATEPFAVSSLLFALLLITFSLFSSYGNVLSPKLAFSFGAPREPAHLHSQRRIRSWLALFEHSPVF